MRDWLNFNAFPCWAIVDLFVFEKWSLEKLKRMNFRTNKTRNQNQNKTAKHFQSPHLVQSRRVPTIGAA